MFATINLKKTNWAQIKEGYKTYSWIMANRNVASAKFNDQYAQYYRINQGIRSREKRDAFFNLLHCCIEKHIDDYAFVINKLLSITGRNEMSFASKIVATVNPHLPVLDAIIMGHSKIHRPQHKNVEDRIDHSIIIHQNIQRQFNDFLATTRGKNLLHTFDDRITQQGLLKITAIKKLDFIFWQTRS